MMQNILAVYNAGCAGQPAEMPALEGVVVDESVATKNSWKRKNKKNSDSYESKRETKGPKMLTDSTVGEHWKGYN